MKKMKRGLIRASTEGATSVVMFIMIIAIILIYIGVGTITQNDIFAFDSATGPVGMVFVLIALEIGYLMVEQWRLNKRMKEEKID